MSGSLKISKKNILLQFYLWAWEADIKKLNICRFFWGIVFLPVGIFFAKAGRRPIYNLSPLAAILLTCIAVPSFCLGKYFATGTILFLVFCSMLYNCVRRDSIAKKCDLQEEKMRKIAEEIEESHFSERTEMILIKILQPVFWIICFFVNLVEKFLSTGPGDKITGIFSLCYHFLKSVKERTCFLIEAE